MKAYFLCFIPMFVAVDALGVLPLFLGFTEEMDPRVVRRVVWQSVVTATAVALGFVAVGTAALRALGITVADFMVAGGALLFVISVSDLLTSEKRQRVLDPESLGAVPLGVPLMAGPAVFATSILLSREYGFLPTAVSILVNVGLAGVAFSFAPALNRVLGKAGAKILSKIASLLLAAIGVMIIRKGITAILAGSL